MAGLRTPQLPVLAAADVVADDKLVIYDKSTDTTKALPVGPSLSGLLVPVGPIGYVMGSDGTKPLWVPGGVIDVTAQRKEITATAGQTTFQTDAPYRVNYLGVYQNGLRLSEESFSALDGINVILDTPAHAGDIILLEGFLGSDTAADASVIMFDPSFTGAVQRTLQSRLEDCVSVKDFGAVGDGVADDTAAIQACVTFCGGQNGRTVFFPAGNYYISAPIMVPNYTRIRGEGPTKSRFNLQSKPYTSHILQMSDATTGGWLIVEDFAFRGGSYAIYNPSPSQESWIANNVSFEIQTIAAINTNSFQINKFVNCVFYFCVGAIRMASGFMNHNDFIDCEFDGLSQQAVLALSASCEVNNFVGCRFEAGGVAGRSLFELANSNNMNFSGCYFEATHPRLINQSGGMGTKFDGCHFTSAVGGVPYEFNSTPPIVFGTNSWGHDNLGNPKMWVTGDNGGHLGKNNNVYNENTRQNQRLVAQSTVVGVGTTNLATVIFSRQYTENTLNDMSLLYGELTVAVHLIFSGGFNRRVIAKIPVFVEIIASGAFGISFGTTTIVSDTTSGAVTVTPSVAGGNTVSVAVAGVGSTLANGYATWSWNSLSGAQPGYFAITADFA